MSFALMSALTSLTVSRNQRRWPRSESRYTPWSSEAGSTGAIAARAAEGAASAERSSKSKNAVSCNLRLVLWGGNLSYFCSRADCGFVHGLDLLDSFIHFIIQ